MSEGEEEGVEDDPVISPIASALGYSRQKKESGDENANPIAKQIASNEPDDEILDLSFCLHYSITKYQLIFIILSGLN